MTTGHILIFGYGYTATFLTARLLKSGWRVSGTTRDPSKVAAIRAHGAEPLVFGADAGPSLSAALADVTHVLTTAPPGDAGDPILADHAGRLAERAPQLGWLGYLSTTGVYGDAGGDWVDEKTPLLPVHARGRRRVDAEQAWQALGARIGKPVTVFRLPGIYGPGRSAFDGLRAGTAKRLVKPGQVFSRIHVEDIAAAIEVAATSLQDLVINVADDEPAPPQDIVTYAARLLGIAPPAEEDFETAKPRLSPMALEFYSASRRISNRRLKALPGFQLAFPNYRVGLRDILSMTRN